MKISGADELPDDLGAMTDPDTGEITVRKGMEFADTFRSLAQELAYIETSGSIDPQFTAYCASYSLCKKYGVDTKGFNFDNVPDMLNDTDPQTIRTELVTKR